MRLNRILGLALAAGLLVTPALAGGAQIDGKWSRDKALCSLTKNKTGEGVVTIKGLSYSEYESSCKIVRMSVPRSSVYKLQLHCDNEGEMGDSVLYMELVNSNHAITSWGTEGKELGDLYRCK
jgi:hypothetical protein